MWRFLEPLVYHSDVAGATITVPAGSGTDGESIALILRSLTGRECLRSGGVHDHLYRVHEINGTPIERDLADLVYEEACVVEGLDEVAARQRYNVVHFYGAEAWELRR